jgi:hypothetical protein
MLTVPLSPSHLGSLNNVYSRTFILMISAPGGEKPSFEAKVAGFTIYLFTAGSFRTGA